MNEEEEKMTGKSKNIILADIESFISERQNDKQLKLMQIENYRDKNGFEHDQIKRLIITGSRYPYKNKLIKIRMEFEDDYPNVPIKMFVEKSKGISFLHANVYNDLGDICHPLLEKNKQVKNIKFTHILKMINQLLYKPNFNNPANFSLNKTKMQNQQKYYQQIEENAEALEDGEYEQDQDSSN